MEDKQIVDLYWERSESAIAETEKKYGRYCHYIAYQILENDEDAKEIVNDTYLKTWQTIPPKRPESLKPYVGMISRQLALNAYEEQHTQKRGQITLVLDELAECLPGDDEDWDVVSGVALHDSLNTFLRGLPQKTRNIFIRRYWYTSSIAEIAEEYSMKDSAVAMLLLRTRNKLKTHLQKEGFNGMTNKEFYREFGNIDPKMIEAAAPAEKVQKKKKNGWVKWASLAACLCLVVGVAFRIAIGFVPNQATDIYREGILIEITSESDLPAQYDGKLLAFNLECSQYEFYYKQDGSAENTEDWYSLLGAKYDAEAEGRIVLHCMFGDTTVDDWKISSIFTKKATEKIDVNGVEVLIARQELSLDYEYWHYAIFEYDDVVYDIRVQSNDAEYVYEVLDTLIQAE